MKKSILKVFTFMLLVGASTQIKAEDEDPNSLKFSGSSGLNISQNSQTESWTGGGSDAFSGIAFANLTLVKKHNAWLWENNLDMAYGLSKTQDAGGWRKASDKLNFASKIGHQLRSPKLYLTTLLDLRTQFAKGYEYSGDDKTLVSDFFAPAYLNISVGLDYKPNDWSSIYFSPVAGRMTFVSNKLLADQGRYGMENGDRFKAEMGASFKAQMSKEVFENVTLKSNLTLFTAYDSSFGDIDVDWDIIVNMKINKYLSANLNVTMKYDNDVKRFDVDDQGNVIGERGATIQIKEVLGVGLAYTF